MQVLSILLVRDMIELKDFTKNYGDFTAAEKISFRFEKNLITGILGPNGAGKTTILKAVCARHFPTEGRVFIHSEKYGKIDAALEPEKVRNVTGFVEENARFPEDFTVGEHLLETCDLHSASRKNVDEAVSLFSLEEVFFKKIRTLSKGFRERLNFARAFVYKPEFFILDEPASGLDPAQIVNMRSVVKKLAENHTVILSTHLMQEAQSLCQRVMILNHGKILASGTIEAIVQDTKSENLEKAFFALVERSGGE